MVLKNSLLNASFIGNGAKPLFKTKSNLGGACVCHPYVMELLACSLLLTLSLSSHPPLTMHSYSLSILPSTVYLHCMAESLWKNRMHIMYTFIRHLTCDTGNLAPTTHELQPGHHWACK